MKVILTEYVYMHGVAGDIVDVANGFARNFLIPQGKAVAATEENLAEQAQLLEKAAIRRAELNDQLRAVADRLEGLQLVFGRKAGRNGKLYGSVTTMDIADAILNNSGVDINRRRVSERSLRELGTFDVPIRMSAELAPVVTVHIVPEEDVEDTLYHLEHGDDIEEPAEGDVTAAESGEPLVDFEEPVEVTAQVSVTEVLDDEESETEETEAELE